MDHCETCGHPPRLHEGHCRVTGCPCTEYAAPAESAFPPRRVSVDVPDGYSLHISLVPIDVDVQADIETTVTVDDEGDGR